MPDVYEVCVVEILSMDLRDCHSMKERDCSHMKLEFRNSTIANYRRNLDKWVTPFFTQVHKQADYNHWPPFAPKLAAYIRQETESEYLDTES